MHISVQMNSTVMNERAVEAKSGIRSEGMTLPCDTGPAQPSGGANMATFQRPLVQKRTFKIIVLGDSNVGKTCLTHRFCQGKFPNRTDATVGVDFREKTVQVGSELIKVGISVFP